MSRHSRCRIAIIDDHPTIRAGLSGRLAIESNMEVCGEADSLRGALQLVERTQPDVAVVDISLRESDGIDLVKRLRSRGNGMKILVWSVFPEDLYAERAFRAGANGYITKDAATDTIVDAIRQILDGQLFASSDLTQHLLLRKMRGQQKTTESPYQGLSDRELQVFVLIGQGQTTQEIAQSLKLSPNTIETYRSRIRQKLNLPSTAQLARSATQWVLENS